MIKLSQEICQEMGLTYWQLNTCEPQEKYTITRDEKELLRKILIAKSVKLDDSLLEIQFNGVVIVNLLNFKLIFNDSNVVDTDTQINLPKLSDMMKDSQFKKEAWFKLKDKTLV
jgi:hypothetical protein